MSIGIHGLGSSKFFESDSIDSDKHLKAKISLALSAINKVDNIKHNRSRIMQLKYKHSRRHVSFSSQAVLLKNSKLETLK